MLEQAAGEGLGRAVDGDPEEEAGVAPRGAEPLGRENRQQRLALSPIDLADGGHMLLDRIVRREIGEAGEMPRRPRRRQRPSHREDGIDENGEVRDRGARGRLARHI